MKHLPFQAPYGMAGRNGDARSAFTLLELLVVLGVAVVLILTLAPALGRTRPTGQAVRCMNNLRQMAAAWTQYAVDSGGILVSNNFGAAAGGNGNSGGWVSGWLDWTSNTDNTNVALLTDPRVASLAPYLSRDPRPFKCPADRFLSSLQRNIGWSARARSISMDIAVGPGVGKLIYIPTLVIANKLTDFNRPTPAQVWVFADEQADSINDNCLVLNPTFNPGSYQWIDLPAAYHNGAGSFSFADGHAEIKKWTDMRTLVPVGATDFIVPMCPFSVDFKWVVDHMPSQSH